MAALKSIYYSMNEDSDNLKSPKEKKRYISVCFFGCNPIPLLANKAFLQDSNDVVTQTVLYAAADRICSKQRKVGWNGEMMETWPPNKRVQITTTLSHSN